MCTDQRQDQKYNEAKLACTDQRQDQTNNKGVELCTDQRQDQIKDNSPSKEDLVRMKLQEDILKRSLLNEGRAADWIDWDQRIKEHEKKRDEENRLREMQVEKKTKKKISMELMHLCINTLREESVD